LLGRFKANALCTSKLRRWNRRMDLIHFDLKSRRSSCCRFVAAPLEEQPAASGVGVVARVQASPPNGRSGGTKRELDCNEME